MEDNRLTSLIGEINDSLKALDKIETFIVTFEESKINQGMTGQDQALALCQALGNYYTCIETMFFRISQFFENSLPAERWHQTLLERMRIDIPDMRPAVIRDSTHQGLLELLKFRHFSRYYYELDYDWDKLRFLLLKFNAIRLDVKSEIRTFVEQMCRLQRDV